MKYFAGIDIGSTAIKVVIIDEDGTKVSHLITPTGSLFYRNALDALNRLLASNRIKREDLAYIVSTGYGRKLFKEADESVSEITANAIGAKAVAAQNGDVRTIINIGGQDSKVISLDENGHVRNFVMNDRCAAGTGRFLEMASRNLEIDLNEMGEYHFRADVPLSINSTCTVFAETEIISLLANGHGREEIIAGIHYSIARRIARLAKGIGIEDMVFVDGGPALNRGLVAAIEDELMRKVIVPEIPQITTALGAAVIAREAFCAEGEKVHA
ncbi:MAG: acyl-CoA dehydratase activase [Thermodesulfovibrionales bacterium]